MKISLILLALSAPSRADNWAPAPDALYADSSGQYYVVIQQQEPGIEPAFTLARTAPGSVRLKAHAENLRRPQSPYERPDPKLKNTPAPAVRKGDIVLARGSLPQTPYKVLVSSAGAGFAVIEKYGMLGSGFAVIFVSSAGRFTASAELHDLFSRAEIRDFTETASSTWWLAHAWLDEEGRRVVVASVTSLVRTVAFDGGAVATAGIDTVLRALRGKDAEDAKVAAYALVSGEMQLKDLRSVYSSEKASLSERLAAAAALAIRGDERGRGLIVGALSDTGVKFSDNDRTFVIAHAGKIFKKEASHVLRTALENGPFHDEAAGALMGLGKAGISILVEVVGSTASASAKYPAMRILGDIRSKEAVPFLEKAAVETDDFIGGTAISALKMIREPESVEALKRLLDVGSKRDGEVSRALFFTYDRTAVPVLIRALGRWPNGSEERRDIHSTLEFLSGKTMPSDPQVWASWLEKNPITSQP